MYGQPAKKLLFMGGEFGQWNEWNHETSLDWHLLGSPTHGGVQRWVEDLNRLYRNVPALYQRDCDGRGFAWVDCNDTERSVLSFLRFGIDEATMVLVVCNFTPVVRQNYQVGVPRGGFWRETLNSDAHEYGGSGQGNMGGVEAAPIAHHGRPFSLTLTLPPLGAIFFMPEGRV
jgi:1,4-alpha-glucan branching enzyme